MYFKTLPVVKKSYRA